jgi:hypothetical protein
MAEREPLSVIGRLELMAAGEVLARYYWHPAMLHAAAKARARWGQIGAACGTSTEQARQDYREWADDQHDLHTSYECKFGMSDVEYAEAMARLGDDDGDPGTSGPSPWLEPANDADFDRLMQRQETGR